MRLIDIEAPCKIEIELYGEKCHATVTAPTVDAVPVVHGHWVKCETADFNLCCSVCKNGYTDYKLSFCYDCGAKMDGGEDDV